VLNHRVCPSSNADLLSSFAEFRQVG